MKHAARVMVPQRSGVILSTSSTAGIDRRASARTPTPRAKHAIVGLTKSVAAELAPHGVRVNAIAPGNTVTGMTAVVYTGDAADLEPRPSGSRRHRRSAIAGEPVDIANAALYLASDEARYVTGHCLVVDAGETTNAAPSLLVVAPALIVEGGRRA